MQAPDPVLAAMQLPQFRELTGRVFTPLTTSGWQVGDSARFEEWRFTPQAFIPPFSFSVRWFGEGGLSQEQEEWLDARQAFGHVRTLIYERNGEQFPQQHLFVF